MEPMRKMEKNSVKKTGGQLKPEWSTDHINLSPHRNKNFMKSKLLITGGILIIASYLISIGLYCFHQGTKSHMDARQAELFTYQLIDNKYDSVRNDILISERTAIKIANQLFSEKYGYWHAFLWKPFDTYLINGYWFVYGPATKSKPEKGPMLIINYHTGETRFKL